MASFSLLSSFNSLGKLQITRFEPASSDIRSDHSANHSQSMLYAFAVHLTFQLFHWQYLLISWLSALHRLIVLFYFQAIIIFVNYLSARNVLLTFQDLLLFLFLFLLLHLIIQLMLILNYHYLKYYKLDHALFMVFNSLIFLVMIKIIVSFRLMVNYLLLQVISYFQLDIHHLFVISSWNRLNSMYFLLFYLLDILNHCYLFYRRFRSVHFRMHHLLDLVYGILLNL